jgi:hypothetical protein
MAPKQKPIRLSHQGVLIHVHMIDPASTTGSVCGYRQEQKGLILTRDSEYVTCDTCRILGELDE